MYNYVLHILISLNNFVNKTFQNKHMQNILVLQDQQTTHSYKRHINMINVITNGLDAEQIVTSWHFPLHHFNIFP